LVGSDRPVGKRRPRGRDGGQPSGTRDGGLATFAADSDDVSRKAWPKGLSAARFKVMQSMPACPGRPMAARWSVDDRHAAIYSWPSHNRLKRADLPPDQNQENGTYPGFPNLAESLSKDASICAPLGDGADALMSRVSDAGASYRGCALHRQEPRGAEPRASTGPFTSPSRGFSR